MNNLDCTHLLPLSLALLMAGCASEPVDYQGTYRSYPVQQTAVLPPQKPVQPPVQQFNKNYANTLTGDYAGYPEVQQFIQHMVQTHRYPEMELIGLFSQARRLNFVIRLESPDPGRSKQTVTRQLDALP